MSDKTVLCIEDNPQNQLLVRRILSSRGYNVVEAYDGLAGWQLIQEMVPPLILLDIDLPGIDGLEIIKRVRQTTAVNHIPVIALTASAMQGDRERFLAAGCDDYLSKPINVMELLETVSRHYPV